MKRFADPDSVLLPKRSQNTFLTESQELSVASPGGDSHEPLAVILQPYFLSQPELSLLKICPPVIHLTITSFPVGLVLWDQKKSTCSPKTHSHFSYRSAFSPSSVNFVLVVILLFSFCSIDLMISFEHSLTLLNFSIFSEKSVVKPLWWILNSYYCTFQPPNFYSGLFYNFHLSTNSLYLVRFLSPGFLAFFIFGSLWAYLRQLF